jgi:glycosyltransferase involved in cell wall biosynthesis
MEKMGIHSSRLSVVPNGVPVLENPPKREPAGAAWTLGTVALFRPRKGTEVLLESIRQLRLSGVDVRLRAVGPFETPEYGTRLRQLASDLDLEPHVTWTGFTADVNAELANIDLFVLPSLYGEGLPMVVLEAMSAGLPVIGTKVEGVPEVIRDGIDGALAQPGSAEQLTACIQSVVSGQLDWQTLSRNARQRQADSFSDQSMAQGVARVYDRLLGTSRGETDLHGSSASLTIL